MPVRGFADNPYNDMYDVPELDADLVASTAIGALQTCSSSFRTT